jgi:hypothetical protein
MHYTPTYSSWINQVERWFAELDPSTDQTWRPSQRASPGNDIPAWITTYNERELPENRRYLPIGKVDSKMQLARRMRREIILTVRKSG